MEWRFTSGDTLLRLDVGDQPAWALLTAYREHLERVRTYLDETEPADVVQAAVVDLWFRLDAIARTWEDVAREWGLPTQLGHIFSYPPDWLDDEWRAIPPEART